MTTSPPKLFFALYKYFPFGGLQKDTLRCMQEALRRGCDVTLFCTSWEGDDPPEGLHLELVHPHGLTNTARMASFGELFLERTRGCDGTTIAMNRIPGADFYFAADSCMAEALPHARFAWLKRLLPRYRAILRQEAAVFSAQEKTTYLLICEKQRREFQKAYPDVPSERYRLLPPGIEETCNHHAISPERRRQLREECGMDDRDLVLITIGAANQRKGIDRVLKSLAELPQNVKYLLVGPGNAKRIDALRKESGISKERFRFLGARRDVADLLCAADLMVHPAREEGTGTVLLEGLSCGLPVVCTEACGFAPYIAEVAPELVVPDPFSQETLTQRVEKVLQALPEYRSKTAIYAQNHDFTARARVFVDWIAGS